MKGKRVTGEEGAQHRQGSFQPRVRAQLELAFGSVLELEVLDFLISIVLSRICVCLTHHLDCQKTKL